jgi:molybdate transport system substrate-binding protein
VPHAPPRPSAMLRYRRGRSPGREPCGAGGLVSALLAALPFAAACGEEPRELLLGAAASLSEPMEAVAAAYEADLPDLRVRLVVGASNLLAEQMRAGAPIDLLVSADPRILDRLAADGLVEPARRLRLAGNRLVVLVRPGLRVAPASAERLVDAEIRRVAVPDAAVPVGRYAREWLAARGLLASLEPRLLATADARATLVAVDAGDVDAAIVYATDAGVATSARVAFEIAADEQPAIVYEAALRSRAGSEARSFFAYLEAGGASRALAAAGFAPPPDAP